MKYIAYTDGSFKEVPSVGTFYSAAAIVAPEGTEDWSILTQVGADRLTELRNVAGELMAVMLLCEYCLKVPDCSEILLFYDYLGVFELLQKGTKLEHPFTKTYRKYMLNVAMPKLKITFKHVNRDAHNTGNMLVDKYAKEAINSKIKQKLEENHGRNI